MNGDYVSFLWCRVLRKSVQVVLSQVGVDAPKVPYVPLGFKVERCFYKCAECEEKKCSLMVGE